MKPELALQNLVNVCEQALLNGQDRRNVNASIQVLAKLIGEANLAAIAKADQPKAE
jgi:hypothetical protein